MGYVCDQHPDIPAALLITNLGTGDTVTLGPECIGDWASALASAFGPDAPAEAPTPGPDGPDAIPVEFDEGYDDQGDDDDAGDQLAEDNAVYEADLRAVAEGRPVS